MSKEFMKCPVCGESIFAVEKVCGHCGAVQDGTQQASSSENMHQIVLHAGDKRPFNKALEFARGWCAKHQVLVGVGEMALGATLIAWGMKTGAISLGVDVVASGISGGALFGAGAGAGAGALAGNIIGAIGVVPLGGIAIPAIAMVAGGVAIFGAFGYAAGDIASRFSAHASGFGDLLMGGSLLAVGVALLLDGAKRIAKDATVRQAVSMFRDGVIYLVRKSNDGIASTWSDVEKQLKQLGFGGAVSGGVCIGMGAALGGSAAASMVTVAGSHTLGAAALSLGLVSAPVWPIFACGAAGYFIWKMARRSVA